MLAHVFLLVSFALTFALTLDLASTLSTEGNPDKQKSVSELKSPMTVTGKAVVEKNCMFGEILSEGGIEPKTLQTKKLEAMVLKTKLLKVGTIQSKHEGRPLVMNGSIAIYKMKTSETKQKILLQEIQWEQLHHLDFDDHKSNQTCTNLRDGNFLGGYCQDTNQTVTKAFFNLPTHNQLKVELSLHVFDQWENEIIEMIVNNQTVWKNRFENSIHHQNFCGNSRFGDQINIPVSKIIDHNVSELNLTLRALTPKNTCVASFAIDNLVLSLR